MSRGALLQKSFLCVAVLVIAGCSSSQTGTSAQSGSADGEAAVGEPNGVGQSVAQLSPEDQSLVAVQKTCPVSGEPLGSMGTPIKVELDSQTVFICCSGCEESLRENPEQYLAKLKTE